MNALLVPIRLKTEIAVYRYVQSVPKEHIKQKSVKLSVYPVHQTELLNLPAPEVIADVSVRHINCSSKDIKLIFTVPCEPGYVSVNGLEMAPRGSLADCRPCGVGYYQPDPEQRYCIQCPDGENTSSIASTKREQCISKILKSS